MSSVNYSKSANWLPAAEKINTFSTAASYIGQSFAKGYECEHIFI